MAAVLTYSPLLAHSCKTVDITLALDLLTSLQPWHWQGSLKVYSIPVTRVICFKKVAQRLVGREGEFQAFTFLTGEITSEAPASFQRLWLTADALLFPARTINMVSSSQLASRNFTST